MKQPNREFTTLSQMIRDYNLNTFGYNIKRLAKMFAQYLLELYVNTDRAKIDGNVIRLYSTKRQKKVVANVYFGSTKKSRCLKLSRQYFNFDYFRELFEPLVRKEVFARAFCDKPYVKSNGYHELGFKLPTRINNYWYAYKKDLNGTQVKIGLFKTNKQAIKFSISKTLPKE